MGAEPVAAGVSYRVEGRAAYLTLDSPHNRNALSTALVRRLHQGFRDAQADPEIRVVVLGHTGGTFCAGADLSESAAGDPVDQATARANEMIKLLRTIVECPLPVLCAVDGHTRAGGLGIVGACDIVVAGPHSTFALTEARICFAPAIISLTLLPKLGPRAAGRYFLTGETFTAAQAAEAGLVTVAADDVVATIGALVNELSKASPQGLAATKALTTTQILADFDRDSERLARESATLFVSAEAHEGMLAFLEKRPPRWAGPV